MKNYGNYVDNKDIATKEKVPTYLTANQTYYVNASTGSDSNSGLTAGAALLTVQAAIDKLPKNLNGYGADINIANGTYAGASFKHFYGGIISVYGGGTAGCTVTNLTIENCGEMYIQQLGVTTLFKIISTNVQVDTVACTYASRGFQINNGTANLSNLDVTGTSYIMGGSIVFADSLCSFTGAITGNGILHCAMTNVNVATFQGTIINTDGINLDTIETTVTNLNAATTYFLSTALAGTTSKGTFSGYVHLDSEIRIGFQNGNTASSPTISIGGVTYTLSGIPTRGGSQQTFKFRKTDATTLTFVSLPDYVCENTSSGNWTYQIYASGKAEMWGMITDASYAMTSAFAATGGYYGPQLTATFPITFSATPYIQITTITPNMGWGMIASPTSSQTYYRGINRTSATGTIVSNFYVRGNVTM